MFSSVGVLLGLLAENERGCHSDKFFFSFRQMTEGMCSGHVLQKLLNRTRQVRPAETHPS